MCNACGGRNHPSHAHRRPIALLGRCFPLIGRSRHALGPSPLHLPLFFSPRAEWGPVAKAARLSQSTESVTAVLAVFLCFDSVCSLRKLRPGAANKLPVTVTASLCAPKQVGSGSFNKRLTSEGEGGYWRREEGETMNALSGLGGLWRRASGAAVGAVQAAVPSTMRSMVKIRLQVAIPPALSLKTLPLPSPFSLRLPRFAPPPPPTSLTLCGLRLSQRLSPTARGASSNLPTQGRMYPPRQCNFHIPPSARMLGWFYARVCLSAPVWWWFHFMPGRRSGPTFNRLLTALGKDESTILPHRRCRRAVET